MCALPAVGVHRRHDVDARRLDEPPDVGVVLPVAVAQEVSEFDQQLTSDRLVTVHVGDVLELRLPCEHTATTLEIVIDASRHRIHDDDDMVSVSNFQSID